MKIKAFTLNEIGGRKNVEDAIMPRKFSGKEPLVFIVCDGVGGSSFGEVASDIATKAFYKVFTSQFERVETGFRKLLSASLDLFKQNIEEYINENPGAANTSTTLTLAAITGDKAYIAWCGDSKIFHLRKGKVMFRSKDHSLVAELVAQGVITEKEAESHPQRNIITRSLNMQTRPEDIEYKVINDLQPTDWFLLCTDGLMEQFTENLFPAILGNYNPGMDYSNTINDICRGKTRDNYSMYLLHLDQNKNSVFKKIFIAIFITAILGAGGWWAYNNYFRQEGTLPAAASAFRTDVGKKIDSSKLSQDSGNLAGDPRKERTGDTASAAKDSKGAEKKDSSKATNPKDKSTKDSGTAASKIDGADLKKNP